MTLPENPPRRAHAGTSSRQRIITRVLVALSIVFALAAVYMGYLGVQALLSW